MVMIGSQLAASNAAAVVSISGIIDRDLWLQPLLEKQLSVDEHLLPCVCSYRVTGCMSGDQRSSGLGSLCRRRARQ